MANQMPKDVNPHAQYGVGESNNSNPSKRPLLTRFSFSVRRLILSDGAPKGTTVEHLLRRLSEASRPRRSPSPSPASSPRVHSHRNSGVHSHPGPGVRSGVRNTPSPGGNTSGGNSPGGVNTPSERYPARVFLCAFMILGHQEAVFNERGESTNPIFLCPKFPTRVRNIYRLYRLVTKKLF